MKRFPIFLLLIFIVFSPSICFSSNKSPDTLINPLRKYVEFRALRPFRSDLQSFVDELKRNGYASEIAVYFRSLNDGVWIGINEKSHFAPASLMKVPLMMVYLKEAETNPGALKRKLKIEKTGNYNQFIPSQVELKKGETYSVEKLLEIMIKDSNNDALTVLSQNANPKIGMEMYRDLGYTDSFMDKGDYLSLKTYVGTFRVLYNATYLNEEMSEKALGYLAQADFDKGIIAGIPKEITVANKFGEYVSPETKIKQLHDVGIVYHPANPYLLGIMTRGEDFEKLSQAIKEISAFIFNEVNRQYKSQNGDFLLKFEEEN